MSTISKSFTAVGDGPINAGNHHDTLNYVVSGTFVGTVRLERSRDGGISYQAVTTKTAAADEDLLIEDPAQQSVWYRWRCTSYTSGTIVTALTVTAPSTGGGGGGGTWGTITGTLADQTDLQSELDAKADDPVDLATAAVTGVLPVANGGTNSSTALANGKVMVSATDKIVESSVTSTTLAFLDATSSVQTQLDAKAPKDSPTFTTKTTHSYATASTVATFNASKELVSSSVTTTTLAFLDATSSIQGQLDLKAPLASPTFSGTVTMPNSALTFTSAGGMNVGQFSGGGQKITFVNVRLSTENGSNDRAEFSCPNGGRFNVLENGQQVVTMLGTSTNWGPFALSRDWVMQWQMGKGTSHYGFGRATAYSSITAGSSTTTEADLISKTMQANLLANDGEAVEIYAFGTTGANANAKHVRLYFGGTAIGDISTSANAKTWSIHAWVNRTGSSGEDYVVEMDIDGTRTITSGTLSVSTTATIIVKVTGEEVITCESLRIGYNRAGN